VLVTQLCTSFMARIDADDGGAHCLGSGTLKRGLGFPRVGVATHEWHKRLSHSMVGLLRGLL